MPLDFCLRLLTGPLLAFVGLAFSCVIVLLIAGCLNELWSRPTDSWELGAALSPEDNQSPLSHVQQCLSSREPWLTWPIGRRRHENRQIQQIRQKSRQINHPGGQPWQFMINLTYFCKLIQSAKMAFGSFLSIREVKTPLNPAATLKETISRCPVYQAACQQPFGVWKSDEMK